MVRPVVGTLLAGSPVGTGSNGGTTPVSNAGGRQVFTRRPGAGTSTG